MAEKPKPREVTVEIPPDTTPDLQPIHDRLQAAEAQVSDLRERLARTETQMQTALEHNPASEEALRLASDAHQIATALQTKLAKLQKEAAVVPEKTPIAEVEPPPAPAEDPVIDQPPLVETPARRKNFLQRLL